MRVRPVDPRAVSPAELSALHAIRTAVLRHDEPDRRRPTRAELRAELAAPWPGRRTAYWLCCDTDDQPVGMASLALPAGNDDHTAYAEIDVLAERRRHGAGRRLMGEAFRMAYSSGRTHVLGRAVDSRDGDQAARACRARPVHREIRSVLDVAAVDIAALPAVPDGYHVRRIRGDTPPELSADIAAVHRGMADAPRSQSASEPEPPGVERVEALDRMLAGRGLVQLRVLAHHRASGEPAGVSYAIVPRRSPARSEQGDTVVTTVHRGRGLGRALKAELLRWLRTDFPRVAELTTWVASDNASMHAINRSLGYGDRATYTHWELPVADVTAYLGMR